MGLSLLGFPFWASPQGFITRLLGRGFLECFVSMWDFIIHTPGAQCPRWHIARCLALIYLQPLKPTTNRYCSLNVLKSVYRERFPHSYKKCFVPLSNRCEISQSTPLEASASLAHHLVSGYARRSVLAMHAVQYWLWYHLLPKSTASRYGSLWTFPLVLPLKILKHVC